MKWKIIVIAFIALLYPIDVKALCYSHEIVPERIRSINIASNIDITSFYAEDASNINFSVRIANISKDIYIVESSKKMIINYDVKRQNPSEIIISGYKPGERLKFDFYPKNTKCINDIVIYTRYVTLPNFNPYYKDQLCTGVSDYYLCKKWNKITIGYEDFKTNVQNYKKSLDVKEDPDKGDEKPEVVDKILDMIDDYYRPVLGTIIVVGIFLIVKETRKNDFGF